MARVTVEDCLENVENRFKLVLLAGKRARQLALGTEPLVEWENDKPTVVALREIAEGLVTEETMQASLEAAVAEENPFNEDDLAAALHAEISRELNQTDANTSPLNPQSSASSALQNLPSTTFGQDISNSDTTKPDATKNEAAINSFAMPDSDAVKSEPPAFGIPQQIPQETSDETSSETSSEFSETPSFTANEHESNFTQGSPFTSSNVEAEPKSEPEPFNPFIKPSSSEEGQDS